MDVICMSTMTSLRFWVDGSCYCYILKHMDEIVYGLDNAWLLLVLLHITEITGKVLLDRNTMYNPIVHRIYGYWYCLLNLLLFTVYMITIYYYVLLLSLYHPSILGNIEIDYFNWIKYNVNEQLTLRLGKLIEETTSVFWVDLGYRLRSRDRVPLQGSQGWLTSHTVTVLLLL